MAAPLAAFRHPAFRLYWAGQAVSLVGTWIQVTGQAYVVTELTPSAWALGLFNVAGSLPMLLLNRSAGAVADRFDKRLVLLWTQVAMAVLALVFGALLTRGSVGLLAVLLLGVVTSVVEAFEFPAAQGLPPELVDPPEIPSAVALMQTIQMSGRLVGPLLAGVLIENLGAGSAFAANAFTFVIVIVALLFLPGVSAPTSRVESPPDPRRGWSYVRADATTALLFWLLVLAMVLAFPHVVLLPYYGRHVLGAGAEGMGTLLSASGVGALLGSLLLLRVRPGAWRSTLGVAAVALGASLMVMAVARGLVVAVAGTVGFCAGNAVVLGAVNQAVQDRVPARLRGRVSALFGIPMTGVLPFSALAVSAATEIVDLRALMVASSITFVSLTLLVLGVARLRPAWSAGKE
jgi:MFS family permease